MKLSPHYLKRYKDIAVLLLKYGRSGLISRFDFDEHGAASAADGRQDAWQLPDDLERLGPTFVKFGQLLSSRPDLVPERYIKPLSRLQDNVKPFAWPEVERTVEEELGGKISKLFSAFEHEPLAAASLGQVHRAALHDGRPVVVKVQRPNIASQIAQDFAALEQIAELFHRHTEFGRRFQLRSILEDFQNTLVHELDYKREAANMLTIGENLKEFQSICIPRPVNDYTTHKILTMEYIPGVKVTELSPLAHLEMNGLALTEDLFRAYLKQVLVDGVFHADPHPGNVLLTEDYRIALLDLGMVGHTTPSMQDALLRLLLAVSEGSSDEAAEIAIRVGDTNQNFKDTDFRHRIATLVAEQQNATLREMDMGKMILKLARTAADTGLIVPVELSLVGKTLLQLDEIGCMLAPNFDPNESVRRNANRILTERMKSIFTEGKLVSSLLETKQFLGGLPSRLNKILDAVGEAEINVNVKPSETEFLVESAQKVANRITTALILAALIIGAALLMRVETSFRLFGYPGLAMICFLAAGFGGFCLVLNIAWKDHQSKQKSRR